MIDLRSDTVTRPSEAMRDAARDAPVGDDVYGEDPSVNELQERAAEVLGTEAAHDLGIPVHLDGARLFNAATAHDVPASAFVDHVDSVMCCLSKGLGAPVGSVLAGPERFVEAARRNRKLLGGGMRQAGMIAAPGLRALANRDRPTEAFLADCEEAGVLGVPFDDYVVRFCTHWDVDDGDVDRATAAVERAA